MLLKDILNASVAVGIPLEEPQSEKECLKLSKKKFPYSIKQNEINFITEKINAMHLSNGVEIATGTGVSSIAIASALKHNNGKLLTIDAYVEESVESYDAYFNSDKCKYENALAFKLVNRLAEYFNLVDFLKIEIGWSPDDVSVLIEKHFNTMLDFAFIDGGHYDAQLILDFDAIFKYSGDRFILFVHDMHCFSDNAIEYIEEKMKSSFIQAPNCQLGNGGFNLNYIIYGN